MCPGRKVQDLDGSSMATPHVAGLAALLLQASPSATANDLERAIVGSCTLPAGMLQARGSHGVPDAVRAFQLLTGSQLPVAAAAAAPSRRVAKRGVRGKTPVRRVAGRTVKKHRPKTKRPKRPRPQRESTVDRPGNVTGPEKPGQYANMFSRGKAEHRMAICGQRGVAHE